MIVDGAYFLKKSQSFHKCCHDLAIPAAASLILLRGVRVEGGIRGDSQPIGEQEEAMLKRHWCSANALTVKRQRIDMRETEADCLSDRRIGESHYRISCGGHFLDDGVNNMALSVFHRNASFVS